MNTLLTYFERFYCCRIGIGQSEIVDWFRVWYAGTENQVEQDDAPVGRRRLASHRRFLGHRGNKIISIFDWMWIKKIFFLKNYLNTECEDGFGSVPLRHHLRTGRRYGFHFQHVSLWGERSHSTVQWILGRQFTASDRWCVASVARSLSLPMGSPSARQGLQRMHPKCCPQQQG